MDSISLISILLLIIVVSKVLAHTIKIVDVLLYIILWFIATQWWLLDSSNEIFKFLWDIWVILLMFYAWWHEDSKTFFKSVLKNKWVAIFWAMWPFLWAYLVMSFFDFSFNEAVVAGFIFMATAVPYTIAVLTSLKLNTWKAFKSIIASAMADDFLSIVMMSAVFSVFIWMSAWESVNFSDIMINTEITLFYLALCFFSFFILAFIVFPQNHPEKDLKTKETNIFSWIIFFTRWLVSLKWFTKTFYKVEILTPLTLFLVFSLAVFSHYMWLHMAIWAYLVWLILHVDMFHSPVKSKTKEWKNAHDIIEVNYKSLSNTLYSLANNFLWPIFFIYLWSQLIVASDTIMQVLWYSFVAFIVIASFQFISASLAARYTAGLDRRDSILVWFAMWPRDALAFVILSIATTKWIISWDTIFPSVVVVTIILLDIATPIALKIWSKQYK